MNRVKSYLKEFGEIMGLQINWYKSERIVFNYNKDEKGIIRKNDINIQKF